MQSVKVRFKPLEYTEVLERKPLIFQLDKKWELRFELLTPYEFFKFSSEYKSILAWIEAIDKNDKLKQKDKLFYKASYFKFLLILIYDLTKTNYKGWIKRLRYKKFLFSFYSNKFELFLDHFNLMLRYQSEIKKKLQEIQSFDPWQKKSSWTVGGIPLSELFRVDENGKVYGLKPHSLN